MFISRLLSTLISPALPSHHATMMETKTVPETLNFLSVLMRVPTRYDLPLFVSVQVLVRVQRQNTVWLLKEGDSFRILPAGAGVLPFFHSLLTSASRSPKKKFLLEKWQG